MCEKNKFFVFYNILKKRHKKTSKEKKHPPLAFLKYIR